MPIVTATSAGPVCIPPPARTACPSAPPSPLMHDPALLGDAIKPYRPRTDNWLERDNHDRVWPRVYEQGGAAVTTQTTRGRRRWCAALLFIATAVTRATRRPETGTGGNT